MVKISKLIFILFLFSVPFSSVNAASLFTTPASGIFSVGDKVTLKIMVSSDLPINAISGIVNFPSIFLIESISKSSSILNFWITEPNFSNGAGTLQFEGVSLGGFPGGSGNVITVILKANKEGTGAVTFKSGQILANDGQGTDLTGIFTGSSFSVKPKIETPSKVIREEAPEEIEEKITEEEKISPTLIPPEIVFEERNGEDFVTGTSAYPKSKILLTFIAEDEGKVFVLGDADSDGQFVFPVPKTLKQGIYRINATVIKEDLSHSIVSNEITVKIGNLFSDLSKEIKISILLLILLLIYLISRLTYLFLKNKKIRYFQRRELKETEGTVRKAFRILDEDVEKDFPKRMTATEKENKEEIKHDLSDAENVIMKEIKGIERK